MSVQLCPPARSACPIRAGRGGIYLDAGGSRCPPRINQISGIETVEKVVERRDTGRKIVTKETQEGCLSFLIIRSWNFFKVSKSSPACRKDFFDKLIIAHPLPKVYSPFAEKAVDFCRPFVRLRQDLGFCPKKARCQLYQKRKKFHFLRDTWENTDNLYTAIFVITAQYYCFVTIVFCALTSNLYAVMMRNEARGLACGILCGGRSRPRMGLWNRPGMIRPAVCGCGRPAER